MHISTFFKENTNQKSRAEVHLNEAGKYYYIDFYDFAGHKYFTESYVGKSLDQVEATAEDWTVGLKLIIG